MEIKVKKVLYLIFRVCVKTSVVVSILILIFGILHKNDNEKLELNIAMKETIILRDNFDSLSELVKKKQFIDAFSDFSNGMSVEEVSYKQEKKKYSLNDLGFENPSKCNVLISVNNSESLICERKDLLASSGSLIFIRNKDKSWVCSYSGDKKNIPDDCLNNVNLR